MLSKMDVLKLFGHDQQQRQLLHVPAAGTHYF
jgi:hypothetical protein